MSLEVAHDRVNSLVLLDVVQFLLDGDWLEHRFCPVCPINRAACGHSGRLELRRSH